LIRELIPDHTPLYGESLVKPVLLNFLASADCAVELLGEPSLPAAMAGQGFIGGADALCAPLTGRRRRFSIIQEVDGACASHRADPAVVRRKASEIAPRKAAGWGG
jgi:hypothetical protein